MNPLILLGAIVTTGFLSLVLFYSSTLRYFPEWSYENRSKIWPEVFLPMAPTVDCLDEFKKILLPSVRLFWPKQNRDFIILTDAESENTPMFISQLKSETEIYFDQLRVATNIATFPQKGHDRQQWLMFWADNFTNSEFIAFVDTDTMFTGKVFHEDLFESGRPRVIAVYGEPVNSWWSEVSYTTYLATGYLEKFKAMTYFPVIIKLSHLPLIREHIRQHMNEITFDEAYKKFIVYGRMSQFNIMLNVLYELRHDEYYWHIQERNPSWNGPVPPGHVLNKETSGIRSEEFHRPRPKQAIHWTWESFGKMPEPANTKKYNEVLKFGFCYSLSDPELFNNTKICDAMHPDNELNPYEWIFEGDVYSNLQGVMDSHLERRKMVKKADNFDWDQEIIKSFYG